MLQLNSLDPRKINWNLLKAFYEVADCGSFLGAATRLGLSQPTLSRQISELEHQLGLVLFERHPRGVRLNAAGEALLDPVRQMLTAAQALSLTATSQNDTLAGTVRITASEVVATCILPAILAQLGQQYPDIDIELVATNRIDNLLEHDADIAIRMVRPQQTQLIARKIAEWPMGFYASQRYLAQHGGLTAVEDILKHRWIGQDKDRQMYNGFRAAGLPIEHIRFVMRCDNQVAGLNAIQAGIGMGIALRLLAEQDSSLQQQLAEYTLPSLPVWLTAHQSLRSTPRIRVIYDGLAQALELLK